MMYPTRDHTQAAIVPITGTEYDYQVRVRGTVYLWGSAGITANLDFPVPLLLYLRNDVLGEPVALGITTAGSPPTSLGTIQPGESLTIPVQNMRGVTATCTLQSTITCAIRKS